MGVGWESARNKSWGFREDHCFILLFVFFRWASFDEMVSAWPCPCLSPRGHVRLAFSAWPCPRLSPRGLVCVALSLSLSAWPCPRGLVLVSVRVALSMWPSPRGLVLEVQHETTGTKMAVQWWDVACRYGCECSHSSCPFQHSSEAAELKVVGKIWRPA